MCFILVSISQEVIWYSNFPESSHSTLTRPGCKLLLLFPVFWIGLIKFSFEIIQSNSFHCIYVHDCLKNVALPAKAATGSCSYEKVSLTLSDPGDQGCSEYILIVFRLGNWPVAMVNRNFCRESNLTCRAVL